jgi:hypothetical protein
MTDGAFYSQNLPFSTHQSADRPNFLLGTQKPKFVKKSFRNEIGTNEAISTVDGAFYSENLPLSKPRSADRPNFVIGTRNAKKVLNGSSSIDNTFYPQVTC